MTLLDAYAVVALVADEPAADEVEALLRKGGSGIVVVNLAEAADVCSRVRGVDSNVVRKALEPLVDGVLEIVFSGSAEAWDAAELRAAHYDRSSSALSLADCFLLAHAVGGGHAIATSDPALAGAARREGVDVHGLPDSCGKRP